MLRVLEIVIFGGIIIGAIILAVKVLPVWIRERAETKRLREERRAKIEAAKSAEDMASVVLCDREMAKEVHRRLGEKLGQK